MSPTFARVGHYHAWQQNVPSIDPPALRSHWRGDPQGTAHILADVVDQYESPRVSLLRTGPAIDASLVTGSHAAGRHFTTHWDCSVGSRRLFSKWAHHTQAGLTHGAAKNSKDFSRAFTGPYVGVPGPSTKCVVPPVARVPGVTRPVSMTRARPRACRPLQLTAQCEQD